MRHIIEGYRWMWSAVRRWKGGPLWQRVLLFALYVLRDAFGTGRRTAVVAAATVALGAGGILLFGPASSPFHTGSGGVAPREDADADAPGLRRIGPPTTVAEDLELHTSGIVRFRGEWIARSDLGGVLDRYGVSRADVIVDGDTKVRVVHDLQRIMTDHEVRISGFRMARVPLSRE